MHQIESKRNKMVKRMQEGGKLGLVEGEEVAKPTEASPTLSPSASGVPSAPMVTIVTFGTHPRLPMLPNQSKFVNLATNVNLEQIVGLGIPSLLPILDLLPMLVPC